MKTITCLLLGLLWGFCSRAQTHAALADKFVQALAQGNYKAAAAMFDPAVTQASGELLQTTWQQLQGMYGGYRAHSIPEPVDREANPVTVQVRFEKSTQGLACNFNNRKQLTGFLLVPPPAERPAAVTATGEGAFAEEEVSIPVREGTLKGSVMLPRGATALTPVALILTGCGPADRNGNNEEWLQTNMYRMLAAALASNGIASLRYDKRMTGASKDFSTGETGLRFDDYVDDAVAALTFLKGRGYTTCYLIGHGEAGLVGMLAAQREPVQAFVALCSSAENRAQVLKRQLNHPKADEIIAQLKQGSLTNDVPQELQVEFRESAQPYLISWMKYDPVTEIARLKMPVLIVGGTTDLEVPATDAEVLKKAAPGAELAIIPGMNHILKPALADKTANKSTYTQTSLALSGELISVLARFLKQK